MATQNLLFLDYNDTLYATNGSTVGTIANPTSSPPFNISDPIYEGYGLSATVLGSNAYLVLADSTNTTSAIWQYNGTAAVQITPSTEYIYNGANPIGANPPSDVPNPYDADTSDLATYNGDLVFGEATLASNSDGNYDATTLTLYNPTNQQTFQPTAPKGGYDPQSFVTLNGTLYFEATDNTTHHLAIYSYDGTSVTEIYNAYTTSISNGNSIAAGDVQGPLVAFNGNLYFGSGQESVYELTSLGSLSNSATDAAGSAQDNSATDPGSDLIVANNHLFFLSADNGIYSLSASNTLTQVLGTTSGQEFVPVDYNNALYFTALSPSNGSYNLYTSSGGTASVVVAGADDTNFIQMGTLLYYNENGAPNLGTFDGTSAGSISGTGGNGGVPLLVVPFDAVSYNQGTLQASSPPVVTAGATASFTGGGGAAVLDSSLTLADASSTTLASATVSIGTGFKAGDMLDFTNQNGITGSYNSSTGVLSLSGTAELSDYQAALESIAYTFSPSDGDPTAGGGDTNRTIGWTVNDGTNSSSVATSTLSVTHAAPVVTTDTGAVTFTGGGPPVVLDSGITVADPDSGGLLQGATISISSGFATGDTLNFTAQNGITGSYNAATEVLTLSGSATAADYRAALGSVTFSTGPSNRDPTSGGLDTARMVSWTVTDGVASSNTATRILDTVHVAPTVTAGATATFTVGGSAAALDGALAVSDPDSGGLLTGASVSISSGLLGGDVLIFTAQNGITGSYNAASGVLTLSGSATLADYQAALESITYRASGDPTHGGSDMSRTISWSVSDGVATSSAVTSALNLVSPPQVAAGATATFTGGGSAATLDAGLTVVDWSSATLSGASIAISTGFTAGDGLSFTNQNGITGSYNAATGVLTLSGSASLANYQAALDSITYSFSPADGDPTGGGSDTSRTITWTVTDGTNPSAAVTSTLQAVHVAATVAAGGSVSFASADAPMVLDPTLTVGDVDSGGVLLGATVSIASGFLNGDTLDFTNQNGIAGAYNATTGVLTLSGSASLAGYQAALQSVAYQFSGDPTANGGDTSRVIQWSVSDGIASSSIATSTVQVSITPPAIAGALGGQTTTDEASLLPFADVSITDPNPGVTETVTVALSAAANGALTNLGGGSYDAQTGIYTVSGTAAQVTAALDALTFVPTTHQVAPGSTVTTGFTIDVTDSDTGAASDSTTSVVATAVDEAPSMLGIWANQGVPDQTNSTPFSGVTVIDPDIGHTETITVSLSGAVGTLSDSVAGSFDPAGGVYTVIGDLSIVEAALQALTFTPAATTGAFFQTATLAVDITNSGGSADGAVTATSLQQILGLAAAPLADDLVDVSPDGTGLPAATPGANNEAVITDPAANGSYTLPSGYQAEFLGGSADATLTDASVGNALLVGNNADDTLITLAGNDTLFGGFGRDTVSAAGAHELVLLHGPATVDASGNDSLIDAADAETTATISGAGVSVLGGSTGTITADITGDGALFSAQGASLVATITGGNAVVFGGSAAGAGTVQIQNAGTGNIIDALASDATINSSGSNAEVVGGSGNTAITVSGSGSTVFGGTGQMSVTGGDSAPTIVGSGPSGQITVGSGGLEFAAQPGDEATINAGGTQTTVFGSAGAAITFQGAGVGGIFVAGSGNETLNAAQSSTGNQFAGSSSSNAGALMFGGSGDDTMIGGAGSDTMTGGAGDNVFAFFADNTDGQHDVITDFSAGDSVYILHYAPQGSAITLDQSAVTNGAGVTLTLSDNTEITFSNLTSVTSLYGHILYAS